MDSNVLGISAEMYILGDLNQSLRWFDNIISAL